MLSKLVGAFPLPKECVVLLVQGTRVCKSRFLVRINVHVQSSRLIVNSSSSSSAFDVMTVLNPQAGGC